MYSLHSDDSFANEIEELNPGDDAGADPDAGLFDGHNLDADPDADADADPDAENERQQYGNPDETYFDAKSFLHSKDDLLFSLMMALNVDIFSGSLEGLPRKWRRWSLELAKDSKRTVKTTHRTTHRTNPKWIKLIFFLSNIFSCSDPTSLLEKHGIIKTENEIIIYSAYPKRQFDLLANKFFDELIKANDITHVSLYKLHNNIC
jgi:hypothetical protein